MRATVVRAARCRQRRGGAHELSRVVAGNWRVAVPRALGGGAWRRAKISAAADVASFPLGGDSAEEGGGRSLAASVDAVVIASDGVWDVLSSDDVAAFVRARRVFRPSDSAPDAIAAALAERAVHLGSTDDCSVAVLLLER